MQRGRVLRDVDQDGAHLEHGGVVGLQAALGAVQSLRLRNVTFHHRPETQSGQESAAGQRSFHFHVIPGDSR